HTGFCHQQGNQQMFTGHPEVVLKLRPDHPDLMTITHSLRAGPSRTLPVYVGLNPIPYLGAAYLGPAHEAFAVYGDPNVPNFEVPNLGRKSPTDVERLNRRMGLRQKLDEVRRGVDELGRKQALDAFQVQAWKLLTGPEAARAFDINQEHPKLRDR